MKPHEQLTALHAAASNALPYLHGLQTALLIIPPHNDEGLAPVITALEVALKNAEVGQ